MMLFNDKGMKTLFIIAKMDHKGPFVVRIDGELIEIPKRVAVGVTNFYEASQRIEKNYLRRLPLVMLLFMFEVTIQDSVFDTLQPTEDDLQQVVFH